MQHYLVQYVAHNHVSTAGEHNTFLKSGAMFSWTNVVFVSRLREDRLRVNDHCIIICNFCLSVLFVVMGRVMVNTAV